MAEVTLRTRGPSERHAAIAAEGIWPVLSAMARAQHRSPAQVALAWVLAHPQVSSVLVSVSSVSQLRELLGATRLKLNRDDIDRLGGRGPRAGARLLAPSNVILPHVR